MNPMLRTLTIAGLLAVVACASDQTRDDAATDDSGSYGSGSATTRPSGTTGDITTGTPTPTAAAMPSGRVFYFEFDSSELKPEGAALADEWAAYLSANPGTRLRLEGHADERGTREYNVGLGERRANAVQQALTSRGVSASQISVSSFGEERPVATGHDEAAWAQNRRVELAQ